MNILLCSIEKHLFAFDLNFVESTALAVELLPLPSTLQYICGAINVHGEIVPVVDMRIVLNMPHRALELKDSFVLGSLQKKRLAFWVDSVKGIRFCRPEELIPAEEILPEMKAVSYVVKEENKIILLYDLEKLLHSAGSLSVGI